MSHRGHNNMSRSTKSRRFLREIESIIHFDTDESDHDNTHFEETLLQEETRDVSQCFDTTISEQNQSLEGKKSIIIFQIGVICEAFNYLFFYNIDW